MRRKALLLEYWLQLDDLLVGSMLIACKIFVGCATDDVALHAFGLVVAAVIPALRY